MHIWFGFRIRLFTNLRGYNQCWETCPKVIKQTHGRWAEQQELVYSCKASGLSTVYNYKGTSKKIDILPCKLRTCLWIYEHWKTFSQMRGFQLHLSSAQRIGSGHSGIGKKMGSRQAWIEWQYWYIHSGIPGYLMYTQVFPSISGIISVFTGMSLISVESCTWNTLYR